MSQQYVIVEDEHDPEFTSDTSRIVPYDEATHGVDCAYDTWEEARDTLADFIADDWDKCTREAERLAALLERVKGWTKPCETASS